MATVGAGWRGVIDRFRAIEEGATKHDAYLDRDDLAAMDEAGSSSSSSSSATAPGLVRLVAALVAVLQDAHAEEQQGATLCTVRSELDKCTYFSENNAKYLRHHRHDGDASSSSISSGGAAAAASNDALKSASWDAADEVISSATRHHTQLKAEQVQRQLRRAVHDLHSAATAVLDAKLAAHDAIFTALEAYQRALVKLAHEGGVMHAQQRARRLVHPQLHQLLAHRFVDTAEVHAVLQRIKELWATAFYGNDVALAERHLALTHKHTHLSDTMGLTRFKMGAGLTLLLWSFSECFNNEKIGQEIWRDPTFAIFMCFGDLLLLLWMWGLSMRVWRLAGIDFVRLLRLEGTEIEGLRTPEAAVYASATDLSLLFLVVFISFNKAVRGVFNIHGSLAVAHALPVSMIVFFVYRVLHPPVPRRRWLNMVWLVLTAPANPVIFRDGYIGDLLTSLVRVLIPMCFSFAYLIMSAAAWLSDNMKAAASRSSVWWQDSAFYRLFLVPFVTLMPLWIRLMQCLRRSVETGQRWPHLANALKYTSALAVISYGTFRPRLRGDTTWVAAFVGATLFQFSWDLTMDWGIVVSAGYKDASDTTFMGLALRRTRLLGPLWIYVAVIVANFFMRFAWALTLLPEDTKAGKSFYSSLLFHLGPMVAAGEVVRRMVWGFFRLEWEQLEVFGSADVPSLSLADATPSAFDKMEVGAARAPDDTSKDGKAAGATPDEASEWVLSSPHMSAVAHFVLSFSPSVSGSSNAAVRARFVEAVFFAGAVLLIIFSAAAPEIHALL